MQVSYTAQVVHVELKLSTKKKYVPCPASCRDCGQTGGRKSPPPPPLNLYLFVRKILSILGDFFFFFFHFCQKKKKKKKKSPVAPFFSHPAAPPETDFFLVWPEGPFFYQLELGGVSAAAMVSRWPCALFTWLLRLDFCEQVYAHTWQRWGLSPVWMRMWSCRL